MPVVSDTSPILGLSSIGHLELLQDQFGEVFIPQAVLAKLKREISFFISDRLYQEILKQANESD
jgi:predicted nucleic acid-binding protein